MPYIPTMPKNRILPVVAVAAIVPLVAWSQEPSPSSNPLPPGAGLAAQNAPLEPPTEAEKELDAAIKKIASLDSVSADVLQSVNMLDQPFEIKGRYLKASGRRVYLRLGVTGLADAEGTMLQVCDGQVLWDYQRILESQIYRKIEIGKVFEKLKSPEIDPRLKEQVVAQLGFAGPEELLGGLRRLVKFDQKAESTLDGKAVWVLTGEWRSREGLTGANQQPLPPTAGLPAFVPSLVKVTLGKEDGWPYKLLLVGRKPAEVIDTRKIGQDGKPIGARSSIQEVKPTRIELNYTNVVINPDLKAEEFAFQAPPGAKLEDNTQALVGMLDQAIQVNMAKKKAEASKVSGGGAGNAGDDSVLKESITIPRVGGDAPTSSEPASSKPR